VGGHQLHVHCEGEGSPTVILEAPELGLSAMWGLVQPALATVTRSCSYDRAGLGWSEAGDGPFDARTVPAELHALLIRDGVPPPYLIVGQSLGAAFARLYLGQYPAEVVGLVLLDDPTASSTTDAPPSADDVRAFARHLSIAPWLARTGILRIRRLWADTDNDLPGPAAGAVASFLARPDHLTRSGREFAGWSESIALAELVPFPAQFPVTRLNTTPAALGAYAGTRAGAEAVTRAALDLIATVRTE
jgi:pimeloyl-ACP methyl ester carboxylesterase